jgi:hypothetical protein
MKFTVMPLMVAMALAIASMPTEIYQICRQSVGTLEIEPWRQKTTDAIGRRLVAFMSRVRAWFSVGGPQIALAAGLLLALVVASHFDHAGHVSMAIVAPAGLKALRQRASDIQQEIQTISDAVAARPATEGMTETERGKLATLKAAKKDNAELLVEAEADNERIRAAEPEPNADVEAGKKATTVVMGKVNAEDDPKRGFKDHRDFLKAVMDAGRGRKADAAPDAASRCAGLRRTGRVQRSRRRVPSAARRRAWHSLRRARGRCVAARS